MRIGIVATALWVLGIFLFVLLWAWYSGGRNLGKEMFLRYVLTILLLLIVQIGGLSVTFFLHWSRQSIQHEHERVNER